jgi:hypothetical protein
MKHVLGHIPPPPLSDRTNIELSIKKATASLHVDDWSLETYSAGWVHLCVAASSQHDSCWQWEFCRIFLEQALGGPTTPALLGECDGNIPVATTTRKWTFPPPSDQLLQGAYRALVNLKPLVKEGEKGSVCLSVLEVALVCLGHGLQHHRDFLHVNGDDRSSLQHYFDDLLVVADELFSLTQPYVLSDDRFQHLNYYLLCFKQFVRLEKPAALGRGRGDGGIGPHKQQRTLDSFLLSTEKSTSTTSK